MLSAIETHLLQCLEQPTGTLALAEYGIATTTDTDFTGASDHILCFQYIDRLLLEIDQVLRNTTSVVARKHRNSVCKAYYAKDIWRMMKELRCSNRSVIRRKTTKD
jgi:hypothetical protein